VHCDSLPITATIAVPPALGASASPDNGRPGVPIARAGQTLTLVTALFTGATPVSTTTTSAAGA